MDEWELEDRLKKSSSLRTRRQPWDEKKLVSRTRRQSEDKKSWYQELEDSVGIKKIV